VEVVGGRSGTVVRKLLCRNKLMNVLNRNKDSIVLYRKENRDKDIVIEFYGEYKGASVLLSVSDNKINFWGISVVTFDGSELLHGVINLEDNSNLKVRYYNSSIQLVEIKLVNIESGEVEYTVSDGNEVFNSSKHIWETDKTLKSLLNVFISENWPRCEESRQILADYVLERYDENIGLQIKYLPLVTLSNTGRNYLENKYLEQAKSYIKRILGI
jgi:hypothetical protein